MITYWPNKQSVELNLAVSSLFAQTHRKFSLGVLNKTSKDLPIDIFNECTKKKLLLEVLIELEVLIIDIVELDISIQELKQLYKQIILHLTNAIIERLIQQLNNRSSYFSVDFRLNYNKLFFYEHASVIQTLLAYLIFGSEHGASRIFTFCNNKTPFLHVKALFENFIIQTSNIIAFNLLENDQSRTKTYVLIHSRNCSKDDHYSLRRLSNFKNNLMTHSLINLYIHHPQSIYCGKYRIWLLSSKGIIYKYIYVSRMHEYLQLSNYQLGSIICLEIQDFVVPRFNQFIALIGKLIIYFFIEIIKKNFGVGLKDVIKKFNTSRY